MHQSYILLLILLTLKAYGQCGQEHPSGFYHYSTFLNEKGDTLNQLDQAGLYEGLHLYSDNSKRIYSDSNSFVLGHYHHGIPVGLWIDHCKDGSFSIGPFSVGGGEVSSDGKGSWVTKHQGIYEKTGVWKYFDRDSHLLKTERYDRLHVKNGWENKTFKADSTGTFILIKLESKYHYGTKRKKETTKIFTDKGIPVSADFESFWKIISYEYDPNGRLFKVTKRKKFLGKKMNTEIEKEYNDKGQIKCKTKTTCKHLDPIIIDHGRW